MSDRETLAQQVYRDLKQRILEGQLSSDEVLTERTLALESGISRTPLRAAISRLEKENVISRLPNGALMVRPVTIEQLLEIVQVRRLLEGAAAEKAASLPFTEELARSRARMREFVSGDNIEFDLFWIDDDAFHNALAHAADMPLLATMLTEMRSIARRCTITRTHDRFDQQALEHIAIIDAIEARDGAAARAAVEVHFDSVRTRFLGWLTRN
ncbi:DNA-binding GntR family transcriptional regulator [Neorhizobium galegae]|uniref:GntR family transcriptional regulator n=1 Tax=Rhizobium/Agrobacterium group TaxID=227290 RepID=UPI001AE77842|nr:GntR family transcriptional regulator [Neorhizobium galegae]MBP2550686.1 DNA-binding GntR family transcriptional regulator [Neorhizobium galegae]